jgi:hypothetical protein
MPKSTHQHQKDAVNTDHKYRPGDEHVYEQDKQDFQASEREKKTNESDTKSSTSSEKDDEK